MRSNSTLQQLDYVQAPNGARLQASTVDAIFSAALSQFAAVVLSSFVTGDFEFIAAILITVFYYAYPLTVGGQTLGKKIYGLRVLPFEDDRPLSWKEALMRETVGKGISYFILLFGFFMILWRDDRRGLHDLISKTVVVQDAAVAERNKGFFAGFAKSVVISCLITSASLSYFYYSSFIADRLEAQFTAQGLKLSDVSGSLAKGFRISGLELPGDSGKANFGTIDIKFSDLGKIFSERTLTLSSIKVSNAQLTTTTSTAETMILGFMALPFLEVKNENEEDAPKKTPNRLKKIVLKTFIAENSKIIDSKKTLELRLIQLTELVIDPKTKSTSWEKLSIRSSLADLDTGKVNFHDGDIDLTSPLSAMIHYIPGVKLRQPIDLVAALSLSKGKITNLQINALANKITVTAQAGKNYQLWVSSLSPGDYLDGLPFDKISFYSSKISPIELVTGLPQTASFQIGSANFIYQHRAPSAADPDSIFSAMLSSRVQAFHHAADAQYTLTLPPGFISTLVMGGGKLELSSTQNLQPEQILYRLGAKNALVISKFFVSPAPRFPASR